MALWRFTRAAICVVALLCAVSHATAQTTTGSIVGVVRDSDGGVVPGAAVTATNTATNATFTANSADNGQYVLRGLPVGPYSVTVELTGFQSVKNDGVTVRVNEDVRLDPTLKVGDLTETVTVSGMARTVDTTTSTLKTVVDQQRIETLPLNGRNPTQLLLLVPGVSPDTRTSLTSGATYPGVQPVSSSGARGNSTNYVLDGGSNNDHYTNSPNPMPNPDALQEFSVQTNNFSAEYGRQMGAIVNAVTRAGTNNFKGLAFGYLRDSSMNANNFFTPSKSDGLKRQQVGGTFGGPIKENRTFFFASYQHTSTKSAPADNTALVPTAAQRAGDFSSLSKAIIDPLTGAAFPGNRIPANRLDPTALKIINEWLPLPNGGAGDSANLVRYAIPNSLKDDQWLARVDHKFSDKHSLYGRFWVSNADQPPYLQDGNILTSAYGRTWRNTVVSGNDTYMISDRMLNNLVVTFNRTNNYNFQVYPPNYSSLGIQNVYNDDAPQWYFTVNGYFGINSGDTNTFLRNELQIVDTVRWTTPRHEIAVGFDYTYGKGDTINNFKANGRYTFNGSAPFTGDALADFMLGKFQSFEQGVGEYKGTRTHSIATFIQDTFRVNPKLTLNLGLRWEPFFPYTDANNRMAGYRPGQESTVFTNAPVGILYPGDAGFPSGGYDKDWKQFGPRVGFAYDPFGDGKSSIRAGYGIFYDRPNTLMTNSQATQAPFGTTLTQNGNAANSTANPYAGATNPFPIDPYGKFPSDVAFTLPMTVFSFDQNMKNGRLQSWNLTLEREIMPTYLLRVAYAGSQGDRLALGRELNPAIYAVGATTSTTNNRRALYPNFAGITSIEPTGESSYHSLQVTLDKRFSKGLTVLATYSLSKALDNSSENKQNGQSVTNPADIMFDWGPANFDRRHRFVTSWLWEIPADFKNPVLGSVLNKWAMSGILTLQSGLPFTIGSGVDNARTGTGNQRADVTGDVTLADGRTTDEEIKQWFNTSAFVANALGTFGTAGRNAMRGPGSMTLDFGLNKTFPVTDSLKLQFRAEAFNLLNHANFNLPEGSRSSGNFGRILSAGDPRIMQLALRVWF
jgi:outer membrane receptor protein involved in Fe transport